MKNNPTSPTNRADKLVTYALAMLVGSTLMAFVVAITTIFIYAPIPDEGEQMEAGELYLLDKAIANGADSAKYAWQIIRIADTVDVPAEWIMCLIDMESNHQTTIKNRMGSGATGLIQWMPATAAQFGLSVDELRSMEHHEQAELIQKYLLKEVHAHGGFWSFTDLYLGVLYPAARRELKLANYDYELFAYGSVAEKQNHGLNYDKQGGVSLRDITKFLRHKYPSLYE